MKHLILLHGWATDSRIWQEQRQAFQDRANLWTPDLPNWEAQWLRQSLQRFDPAETVLVGWSLGGMLALEACAGGFAPAALVLIAACASFCQRPDYQLGVAPAVLRGMRRRLRDQADQVVQDFQQQLLAPSEAAWQEGLQELLPLHQDPGWLAAGLDYLRYTDLRPILAQVRAGTVLVVHGTADRITPVAQAYFLEEHLPTARLQLLRDTGHVPMLTHGREVNSLLATLLS